MVKIAKAFVGPNAGAQLFAGDQDTRTLEQHLQYLEGLFLQLDAASRFTDLSSVEISLKRAEFDRSFSIRRLGYSVLWESLTCALCSVDATNGYCFQLFCRESFLFWTSPASLRALNQRSIYRLAPVN